MQEVFTELYNNLKQKKCGVYAVVLNLRDLYTLRMHCSVCDSKEVTKSWKVAKYQYYHCNSCGSLFLNPLPRKYEVSRVYDNFEYQTGFINESKIRLRARSIIEKCLDLHPKAKNLLDVGCGAGFLLDEAKKFGLKPFGIEPSVKLAQYAKEKYKFEVQSSYVGDGDKELGKKFYIVILSHVLEHVENPRHFLEILLSYLSKNGILYIETPNYSGWLAEREKENYTFLTPPEHISLFSFSGLSTILQQFSNLTIECSSTYSEPEHVVGALKQKSLRLPKLLKSPKILKFEQVKPKLLKKLKLLIVNKFLAPLFLPLFNLGGKGSYLAFYIRKK